MALRWFSLLLPLCLIACSDGYSANTYAANAAQQQAAVERGVIIGVRPVLISANGTVGAATGGAAGGVAGAQVPGGLATAFGAIGGTLVGGISGAAAEKAIGDTKAWEYIVQETGEKLVSITQTSKVALPVGLHVLVIAGTQQARIVQDYTVQTAPAPVESYGSANVEVNLSPVPPLAGTAVDVQVIPSPPDSAADDSAATNPSTSGGSGGGR